MTRLLVGTAVMVAALALIMAAIRLIGGWAAPPAATAILDNGACPQPCWFGIQPGKTTFRQAQAILEANHFQTHLTLGSELNVTLDTGWVGMIWRRSHGGETLSILDTPIQYILLYPPVWPPDNIRLGEAVILFGEPLASALCPLVSGRVSSFSGFSGTVFFQDNIEVGVVSYESRFDPQMRVWSITYHYPAEEPPYRFDMPPWRGFAGVDDQGFCSR